MIHVRNWEKFQHPDVARNKRGNIPWIRLYTELLSDEAFLSLTEHRRLVLICVWLEYARTRARLPLDTRSLSRRFHVRVTSADLAALNHAGFLTFPASDLQADNQQPASLEESREDKRLEKKATSTRVDVTPDELAERRSTRGLEIDGRPIASLADYIDETA